MLKEMLRALTGKSRYSKAGKKYLEEEKKKAKYKRSQAKKKKEGEKKGFAYFRIKGLENKQSEDIEKLMKEFKSKRRK